MTRKNHLKDYEEINRGFVAFGGNSKGEKITGKGKIRTSKLDFEDVYFVKELKFNFFIVPQMCYKKNSVLFIDSACVVLSPDFNLTDESHVLLNVPRKDNMYSVDLNNVVHQGGEEEKNDTKDLKNEESEALITEETRVNQMKDNVNSTNRVNALSLTINAASNETASTPMETHKTLLKDEKGEDVDEHLYRFMIRSLMYLTSLRPDIMFAVCACARFQVNPKISHLHDVKRIFRYLKVQPKLGLWYPKDLPFDLVAYTNNDYAGASLDRISTIGVKNLIFYSKTKHIEIRHHFIRYSNEKKLTQMIKIHTDNNVADLLIKAFDIIVNVNPIKYALTMIPTIYTLCIEQLWATANAKNINGEAQIHANLDGKK
nr:uncharacterized mitochondrial protein AtMg00810-like [Tanacetum cinerariifolium]